MNLHYQIIRTTPSHLFLLSLLLLSFCVSFNVGKTVVAHRLNIICIDQERDALLKFKNQIDYDGCGLMYSWGNPNTPDCCTWDGVSCSSQSGHVIGLNLSGDLYEQDCLYTHFISPSLSELKFLKYLDLSSNDFNGVDIPSSIGSLVNLIHLNLSNSGFSGNIPHLLGNLSRLTSLDLSRNEFNSSIFQWLFDTSNYPSFGLLLQYLDLSDNSIQGPIPDAIGNFQSLMHMDLSYNLLSGSIPSTLGVSGSLEGPSLLSYIDLSNNQLEGTIPASIANLEYLGYLDLSTNYLTGDIPYELEMRELPFYASFANNNLSGSIPKHLSYLGPDDPFRGNPGISSSTDTTQGDPSDLTDTTQGYSDKDGKDKFTSGPYLSVALGFITGFWVVWGTLTFKSSWRHAYFQFVDHIGDNIYVIVAVNLARFRRNSEM